MNSLPPDQDRPERALLVGCYTQNREECDEHLRELALLADTYGAEVIETVPCPLRKIDKATYLGSGKVDELVALAKEQSIDIVVFDDEISPSQQRNLERHFQLTVMDRAELILEVFAAHARTKEAHLQIELAQVNYLAPRLKRMWTHLSRQRGGGVYLKGAGEKQLEIDKRLLDQKRSRLEEEIAEVRKHRQTQRSQRLRSHIPTFAIVGYTNAGKSTLLNRLTDADVLVEDQLFATLDTTTRKFILPNKQEVLLIDTVGFIRKLPTLLIAAFMSTLEETIYADMLIHVIDGSSPAAFDQAEATCAVLKELGAHDRPTITVLNKSDLSGEFSGRLKLTYPKTVAISAETGEGIDDLTDRMVKELAALRREVHLRIPQSEYGLVTEVMRDGELISQDYEENDTLLHARVPPELMGRLTPYLVPDDSNSEPEFPT